VQFITNTSGVGYVEVGGERFYSNRDGVKNVTRIHQVVIPKDVLNGSQYNVFFRQSIIATPNNTWWGRTLEMAPRHFKQPAASGEVIRFLAISDIHSLPKAAVSLAQNAAAATDLHFIVLAGDILSHVNGRTDIERLLIRPMADMSGGSIPVFFARGNHEMYGAGARYLSEYIVTPCEANNFYYTFRYGDLFGVVLDLGIDRPDAGMETNLAWSDAYRREQIAWLNTVVVPSDARFRVAISHIPLTTTHSVFRDAAAHMRVGLRRYNLDFAISGHTHSWGPVDTNINDFIPVISAGYNTDMIFGRKIVGTVFVLGRDQSGQRFMFAEYRNQNWTPMEGSDNIMTLRNQA
jgi:predicted phosphodiesterase